jgi:ubiquinone/menaquinone biosynthesis C-methylase UbiE
MSVSSSFYSLYYDEEWLPLLDKGSKPRSDAELIRRLKKQVGHLQPETIVDVGCGNGGHTFELAESFPKAQIAGVDPFLPALEEAVAGRASKDEDRIFFLPGTLENLPFEDESTDLIWCFDTFCHASRPAKALEECHRILDSGGHFLIASPSTTPQMDPVTWKQLQSTGISRKAMDANFLEDSLADSGFKIIERDNYSSEFLEVIEKEDPGRVTGDIFRLTRLVREREQWESRWGREKVENLIALVTFNLAILTGKIEYHYFLLRKKIK